MAGHEGLQSIHQSLHDFATKHLDQPFHHEPTAIFTFHMVKIQQTRSEGIETSGMQHRKIASNPGIAGL